MKAKIIDKLIYLIDNIKSNTEGKITIRITKEEKEKCTYLIKLQ